MKLIYLIYSFQNLQLAGVKPTDPADDAGANKFYVIPEVQMVFIAYSSSTKAIKKACFTFNLGSFPSESNYLDE